LAGGATFAGFMLNVGVKRVSIKFLALPLYLRLPMRVILFGAPFGAMYGQFDNNITVLNNNFEEVYTKLLIFKKTGDIRQYMGGNLVKLTANNQKKNK
jgi:hypothetical protein